jgi:hypothetical protein
MTRTKPEADQEAAQQEPLMRERKRTRKPGRDVNEVLRVSEDGEEEPEFLISLPVHVDVRKFVKRNYGGGDYLIKNRIGGKFKGERELHIEFAPDENLTDDANDDLDADEFEPIMPDAAPTLDPQQLAKIVAATVNATMDAHDRSQRASQGTPDPMDTFRQMRELLKEEREEMRREMKSLLEVQGRTPPAVDDDEETSVAKILVKNPAIAERVMSKLVGASSDAAPEAWYASVAKELSRNPQLLNQGLGALQSMFKQPAATPTNGNGNGKPASQPQQQVDPITVTLVVIAEDLKKNKRVGRAADAIDELFLKMPEVRSQVEPFLLAPPNTLLAQLSQLVSEDLSTYSHGVAWIEDLQFEMRGDEGNQDDADSSETSETVKSKVE